MNPGAARSALLVAALVGCVGLALAARAFWLEPRSLHVVSYELAVPGWPAGCDGTRVAVLSDLHVGSPFNGIEKLRRVVALTLEAKPDLVLLTGDYVIQRVRGGTFVAPEVIAGELRALSAPLGVFAVLGNHDWWLSAQRVREAFESAGIAVLEDAAAPIAGAGCSFALVGIGDFWEGRHDVKKALAGVAPSSAILAFTHNPDVFPAIPASVSLTIAGHTHGGQVSLPFVGPLIVPSRYGQRYARGHIEERGRHLFVSIGIGTSILPVRFGVPPEISLLSVRGLPAAAPR